MIGFMYRRAVGMKEAGERLARRRMFSWLSGPLIRLGLAWRSWTLRYASGQSPAPQITWHDYFVVEKMHIMLIKNKAQRR